jgi:hypothetical protein
MQHASITKPSNRASRGASPRDEPDLLLSVVVLYQDGVTRHWATELWDRVGSLLGAGGICRQSWKISDLNQPGSFAGAVRAATEADVLVVSIRDAQELPLELESWIESWLPGRDSLPGALVALIGVPPRPDAQSGCAHSYLADVARRGGLDFLPRERKLPEHSDEFDRTSVWFRAHSGVPGARLQG